MLAQQSVLGLGVVKRRARFDLRKLFPGGGRVARLAGGLEHTMVGVGMAITAPAKGHSHELHHLWISLLRLVTLPARDRCVRAGKGEARP